VRKDLEATLAACRPWNERGLKNFAGYQDLAVNETAPASPNPHSPDARQSKTKAKRRLTDAAGTAAGIGQESAMSRQIRRRALATGIACFFQNTSQRRNDMTTSSVRAMLLGALITASVGVGYAIGAQPHMNESIALLLSARGELQAATPNKGGHRERAMGLIDQAIGEVRAGIAFAGG
jgi:hypothetical protein